MHRKKTSAVMLRIQLFNDHMSEIEQLAGLMEYT